MTKRAKKEQYTGINIGIQSISQNIKDIKYFGGLYWICIVMIVFVKTAIYTFKTLTTGFISEKYSISLETSAIYLSVIDIISLIGSPVCGWIIDIWGKIGLLTIIANILALFGYILLGYTDIHPLFGIILLGLHFSLMPPAVSSGLMKIVLIHPQSKKNTGIAYAIPSCLLNVGLTITPPLNGIIGDTYGFVGICLFMCCLTIIGVIMTCIMIHVDDKYYNSCLSNLKHDNSLELSVI